MSGSLRGVGVLVELFSDFLQRLFEGNGTRKWREKQLQKNLKQQANLSIDDLLNDPWANLKPKLEKVHTKTLDQVIQFQYDKLVKDPEGDETVLKTRILELIDYLDQKRTRFSLERNTIKNALCS